MSKGFRPVVVAVASAVLVTVVSPALAGNSDRVVPFRTAFTDAGTRVSGVTGCPTGSVSFAGTAYFRAPLKTTDTYTGCLSYNPLTRSFTGEGFDKQTGFLAGCGYGSFVMHQTELHSEPMPYDATTNTARLSLHWSVVPGSGTGDFLGASGAGSGYGDFSPPTAASFPGIPNSGIYTGSITCPRHT